MVDTIRIDIGCGSNKRAGFTGIDSISFPGVDIVHDLRVMPWPFETSSVHEANCSHYLEHLTNFDGKWERIKFFNELYRVLKPGGQCLLTIPHWCSNRYFGDPTHKEPFSEFGVWYLLPEWRMAQAPHTDFRFNPDGYQCWFDSDVGSTPHPELATRHEDTRNLAMKFCKDATVDLVIKLTARE